MNRAHLSRRRFALLAAGAAAATRYGIAATSPQPAAQSAISAQELIDRLRQQAKPDWLQGPSAGLKAGNPAVSVRGITTTAMATMDVLKQAVKSGSNLVFSYEPTFFGQSDSPAVPAQGPQSGPQAGWPGRPPAVSPTDPVYIAKKQFIDQNGLVIYRVGDHWKAGEDLSLALGEKLGWSRSRVADDPVTYVIPATDLGEVLGEIRLKLGVRGGMRAVGDSRTKVQRIALLPGLRPMSDLLKYLPQSDLVIVGETRDWEGPEYSSDANAAGLKKGYAQLGRVVSEQPGMLSLATWIQSFVREVPVQAVAANDPYWRPA